MAKIKISTINIKTRQKKRFDFWIVQKQKSMAQGKKSNKFFINLKMFPNCKRQILETAANIDQVFHSLANNLEVSIL